MGILDRNGQATENNNSLGSTTMDGVLTLTIIHAIKRED
jgi:hypothetical protein